jgi:energy-coupling factor transport system permease protein
MKDSFTTYHPIVNFTYFAAVIGFAMFIMQPVCMMISLGSALVYSTYVGGKKAVAFNIKVMIPMLIIAGLMNPVFNHEGGTIITYLKDGNPLTLESIMFGIATAVMIISVILWFSCYNQVMTSDKFIYLFGRVIPALSLIIGMALRFIPRFKAQLRVIINAQKCVGRDISTGSLWRRLKNSLKILSILISWALENAIETGDSMKSRGYGLPGRTAFSIYEFDKRDKGTLLFLLVNIIFVFIGIYYKGIYFRYFPTLKGDLLTQFSVGIYISYGLVLNTPMILNIREDIKWKTLKSRI